MKKFLLTLCTVLMVSTTTGAACKTRTAVYTSFNNDKQKMAEVFEASVALVSVSTFELLMESLDDVDGRPERAFHGIYCSAFFISERVIMTAAHCVEEQDFLFDYSTGRKVIVSSKSPAIGNVVYYTKEKEADKLAHNLAGSFWRSIVVSVDEVNDVAILEIEDGAEGCEKPLKMATLGPQMGDEVFSIGHPSGLPLVLTSGLVSSLFPNSKEDHPIHNFFYLLFSPYEAHDFLLATTKIYFVNSGGALLNTKGEIVGIASMIASGVPHLGIFSSYEAMKHLLSEYEKAH
jgi:S1-C subfamily serine protease